MQEEKKTQTQANYESWERLVVCNDFEANSKQRLQQKNKGFTDKISSEHDGTYPYGGKVKSKVDEYFRIYNKLHCGDSKALGKLDRGIRDCVRITGIIGRMSIPLDID